MASKRQCCPLPKYSPTIQKMFSCQNPRGRACALQLVVLLIAVVAGCSDSTVPTAVDPVIEGRADAVAFALVLETETSRVLPVLQSDADAVRLRGMFDDLSAALTEGRPIDAAEAITGIRSALREYAGDMDFRVADGPELGVLELLVDHATSLIIGL